MKEYQITSWCHRFIRERVKEGDFCIDATAGNGNDTVLLAELVGTDGKILAFDIQEQALKHTEQILREKDCLEQVQLILDGHEHMGQYAAESSVDGIVFNFGYLPGGDHAKSTSADTSIAAIDTGLKLLKKKGFMSLCIYSGGDTGYEEKEKILDYLKQLDSREYMVILSLYYNRPNDPPIPAFILKL